MGSRRAVGTHVTDPIEDLEGAWGMTEATKNDAAGGKPGKPSGKRKAAVDRDAMSPSIRQLILTWGDARSEADSDLGRPEPTA